MLKDKREEFNKKIRDKQRELARMRIEEVRYKIMRGELPEDAMKWKLRRNLTYDSYGVPIKDEDYDTQNDTQNDMY